MSFALQKPAKKLKNQQRSYYTTNPVECQDYFLRLIERHLRNGSILPRGLVLSTTWDSTIAQTASMLCGVVRAIRFNRRDIWRFDIL
jgi:hypothetical protein